MLAKCELCGQEMSLLEPEETKRLRQENIYLRHLLNLHPTEPLINSAQQAIIAKNLGKLLNR